MKLKELKEKNYSYSTINECVKTIKKKYMYIIIFLCFTDVRKIKDLPCSIIACVTHYVLNETEIMYSNNYDLK